MSLSELSTELHLLISSFLPIAADLNALSQTSKYWQAVCGPGVYANPVFKATSTADARRLLLTILKYPELADRIRSIEVRPEASVDQAAERRRQGRRSEVLQPEFWQYTVSVQGVIDQNWPAISSGEKASWLSDLLREHSSLDAVLALIMTLARNLESLHLASHRNRLSVVATLLYQYRAPAAEGAGPAWPFSKLKRVSLRSKPASGLPANAFYEWAPVPANVETLILEGFRIDHLEYPFPKPAGYMPVTQMRHLNQPANIPSMPADFVPKLLKLELVRVHIDPDEISENLASGIFRNLKKLTIVHAADPQLWCDYDYGKFSSKLEEHVPDLQELEMSIAWLKPPAYFHAISDVRAPMGSLQGLKDLTRITVDLGFMLTSRCVDAGHHFFSLPWRLFPANVKEVYFTNVQDEILYKLIRACHGNINRLGNTAAAFPTWKKLRLDVRGYVGEDSWQYLKDVSRHAAQRGLKFEVYYKRDANGERRVV